MPPNDNNWHPSMNRRNLIKSTGLGGASIIAGCLGDDDLDAGDREYWDFDPSWPDWPWSPDGDWRVAGPWTGTGDTYFHPDHADVVDTYDGEEHGYLLLTVQGTGPDGDLAGAEIEAREQRPEGADDYTDRFTYGYYQTRMKVPTGPGVYSFFWKPGDLTIITARARSTSSS